MTGLKRAGTNFFAAKTAVADWKGKMLKNISFF